jgi:hypothetical protein
LGHRPIDGIRVVFGEPIAIPGATRIIRAIKSFTGEAVRYYVARRDRCGNVFVNCANDLNIKLLVFVHIKIGIHKEATRET